ncbi:MarR family winged helix-turn-helix transcriptional regulator [Sulfoacidibacillus ferrooxidans]|uniref:HTH-type transcriptional regulator SarZ n=1 Tax=Sulfoacidibacillus ferrooxidans TaxID=2005001 RepID=A0A9X2ACE3_9BACL|nr:hypothetical protein [Sulfoacidibacillus ferrooxidans]MCI0183684.1 hypothetical protein [Sulfoacidibacillus ferrooxidans]
MLKRMEEKGWITRERSRIDERVVNVSVTEAGKALYAESECIPAELMERIGFNEPEYQLLLSQLHTLLQHLSSVSSED